MWSNIEVPLYPCDLLWMCELLTGGANLSFPRNSGSTRRQCPGRKAKFGPGSSVPSAAHPAYVSLGPLHTARTDTRLQICCGLVFRRLANLLRRWFDRRGTAIPTSLIPSAHCMRQPVTTFWSLLFAATRTPRLCSKNWPQKCSCPCICGRVWTCSHSGCDRDNVVSTGRSLEVPPVADRTLDKCHPCSVPGPAGPRSTHLPHAPRTGWLN